MDLKNIPLNKVDFDERKWQEIIENCPEKQCINYNEFFFAKAKTADAMGDPKCYEVFALLTAVSSFTLVSESNAEPYGLTARVLEDVLESHLETLQEIAPTVKDPEMRARIADLLWVKKRRFSMAELAVEAYLESAKVLEDPDRWPACAERIERATRIAVSIGSQNKGFGQVFDHIESVLGKLMATIHYF